jgi:hypothetical protein
LPPLGAGVRRSRLAAAGLLAVDGQAPLAADGTPRA